MKLLLFIVSVLLFSCKQDKKYYIYTEVKKQSLTGGYDNTVEIDSVYEATDSGAYWKGLLNFEAMRRANQMITEHGSSPYKIPLVFKVINTEGIDIATLLSQRTKDSIQAFFTSVRIAESTEGIDSSTLEQAKVAYGSLKFGVTQKEFNRLPYEEKERIKEIGNIRYVFDYSFDNNDQLYQIDISSFEKTANYIDTDVKEAIDNLIEVITKKYGEPKYLDTYPSVFDYQPGYIKWMRKWVVGNKIIFVGSGEVESGSEFYAACRIFDREMYEKQNEADNKAADKVISEDANKF